MFNNHVALFIPTKRGDGTPIVAELYKQWFDPVKTAFANMFGGYTMVVANGGFISSDNGGKFIEEEVHVIMAFCTDSQLREARAHVYGLARKLKFALVQECIALVINGQMKLIS